VESASDTSKFLLEVNGAFGDKAAVIAIAPHPLLEAGTFVTRLPKPLREIPSSMSLQALLTPSAVAPLASSDEVREAVRALLRHGGYKPTGRGKPASEYLVRAAQEGTLRSINAVVDACNAASLHSGLPISVVDLDRAKPPHRIEVAREGERYPFNASGQEIDLAGLLCLYDAQGPCANAVKDAQRTKTHDDSVRTLSVVWGTKALPGRLERTVAWYRDLVSQLGAETRDVD
jgi:DNA/RNA-binding domain of Phe-tRNA-synthetase-like protein